MEEKSQIYIVCSDQTRNGKTLFARCYTDFLLVKGGSPFVMDLDEPTGDICEYYPEWSEVYDITKVAGQMELFDWIIANPGRDYVLDVPARHLDKLFTAMDDINFVNGAREAGFETVVFYLLDGAGKSLDNAEIIHDNYTVDHFFIVRKQEIEDDLKDFSRLSIFHDVAHEGHITLPALDAQMLDLIEDRQFSFREFIEGEPINMDAKAQFKLATFLESLVDDIQRIKRRVDIGNLHRAI